MDFEQLDGKSQDSVWAVSLTATSLMTPRVIMRWVHAWVIPRTNCFFGQTWESIRFWWKDSGWKTLHSVLISLLKLSWKYSRKHEESCRGRGAEEVLSEGFLDIPPTSSHLMVMSVAMLVLVSMWCSWGVDSSRLFWQQSSNLRNLPTQLPFSKKSGWSR